LPTAKERAISLQEMLRTVGSLGGTITKRIDLISAHGAKESRASVMKMLKFVACVNAVLEKMHYCDISFRHFWVKSVSHRQTYIQTDRQTERPAGMQAGRQTDRQTDRKTGGQAGRQAGRRSGRWTGILVSRLTDIETGQAVRHSGKFSIYYLFGKFKKKTFKICSTWYEKRT
jgi:hypothetical protein